MGESRGSWIVAAVLGAAAGALAVVVWFAAWLWLGGKPPWTPHDSLERRIAVGAAALPAPPGPGSQRQTAGYRQYAANCVRCHGEPGVGREAWASGLDPAPTDLPVTGSRRDARQIFWILEPGCRHSAPIAPTRSFGPSPCSSAICRASAPRPTRR